jgi:hypothetical protein
MSARKLAAVVQAPDTAADASAAILAALARIERSLDELRADLSRARTPAAGSLVDALRDWFGAGGRFTARGALEAADEDVALADALVDADIDLDGLSERGRATRLGKLLARLPDIAMVASQRGVTVFCVRT